MQTSDERLWQAVLSKLQRTERPRLSWAEARGLGVEPEALMAAGWFRYAGVDCEAPDCECGVEPNVEVGLRDGEGLVSVSCVAEPACFGGRTWVPRADIEWVETTAGDVFRAIAPLNGVAPVEIEVPGPFVPVGVLRRRGLEVLVVWLGRSGAGGELLCRGLKSRLDAHVQGLLVLTRGEPPVFAPADRIVALALPSEGGPRLGLTRGLDVLDPGYRAKASSREHPELDLDFVQLGFSTTPERHVLTINGHEFDGFKQSDVLFTQLLMLAASRKHGRRDGWRSKAALVGDFAARPSEANLAKGTRALENLRAELGSADVPGLTEEEIDAIIKVERGTGKVRIGIPAENITLDHSLAMIEWKVPRLAGRETSTTRSQAEGLRRACVLHSEFQRLANRLRGG
jgi:hypothetical protein